MLHELGKELIIRIPLIPGVNDGEEFRRMMSHLTGMERLKQVHLLPFHQAGSSKYVLSDTPYELEEMAECDMDCAREHAYHPFDWRGAGGRQYRSLQGCNIDAGLQSDVG